MHNDHPPEGTGARFRPADPASPVTLDRAVQGRIGAELRSLYGYLTRQPLPDRLQALVERIGRLEREEPDER